MIKRMNPHASKMDFYPTELRTNPVSLILIAGYPELHSQLEVYFSKTLKPSVHVLKHSEDNTDLEQYYPKEASEEDVEEESEGMLKVTWIRKLRKSHPAVIVVFFPRTDLDSDTERWDDLISRLQTFKECVSRHHSKLVAVIVSEEMKDLSPDITSTLKLRFGLDDKSLLSLLAINVDPNDSTAIQLANNELKTIGHAILENAWIVHQEHAQRIIQEATKRLQTPTQRNVLDNCKLGFLAEFQQDWTTAASQYGVAYRHLLDLLRTQDLKNRLLLEALYVAEFINMKLCQILMHQQRSEEVWKQFHLHLSKFRIPTGALSMGLHAFFLGWLSRQYEIMLENVNQRTGTQQNLLSVSIISRRHLANLYYYAAEAAVKERRHVDSTMSELSAAQIPVYDFVVPSAFWGQFKLKSDDAFHSVPDDVLDGYLFAMESNKSLQQRSIDLLEMCLAHFKQGKHSRNAAHVSSVLAEEQLASGDVHVARENLLNIADIYRRDGWNFPLSRALRLLIEISAESHWEKAIYCLELSALVDVTDIAERTAFARSGIENLLAERSDLCQSKLWESDTNETELLPRKSKVKGDVKDIGWSSVVEIVCGFEPAHELDKEIHFGVALKNNLPAPLPIHSLSVRFLEHRGQSRVIQFEDASSIHLTTGRWKEFVAGFVPVVHGEMRAEYVELKFGPNASLAWHLRLSSKGTSPQETVETDPMEKMPFRKSVIVPGIHSVRIKHVGPSPTLKIVGPRDIYLGEKILIRAEVGCEARFEGDSLRLDLSCDNSMGHPQWTYNNIASYEIPHVSVEANDLWRKEAQILVSSFGVVSVRATLNINSEAQISECLSFEVKEPFQVENRVLSPPSLYLFLPSPSSVPSPLTTRPSHGKTTTPFTTVDLAEGIHAFVHLSIKCKADCDLVLMDAEYLPAEDCPLETTAISGQAKSIVVHKDDVQSMIFKIFPKTAFTKSFTSSLSLKWKRREHVPLRQLSGSLVDEAFSTDMEGTESSEAVTLCRLHGVTTQKPLLSARCQPPSLIRSGVPFPIVLHLYNETVLPEEFELLVMEYPGCLFAGDRSNHITITPHGRRSLKWECVAHNSGRIQLPKITISSARLNAHVEMEGIEMFSEPSPL